MDKDIQQNLLRDLKNAKTIDEKISFIIVFLEFLGDWNLSQVKVNDSVAILNNELLKAATSLTERLLEVEKFLEITMNNVTNLTENLANLQENHNKALEHIETLYNISSRN